MRGPIYKISIALLAVLALTLLAVGLYLVSGTPTTAKAESLPAESAQQPDNSQCLACHSQPDQVMTFPNGDTVSISIDPAVFGHAVHSTLACQVCHTNITDFPHPQNSAQSAREYTLEYKDTCQQCHPSQVQETMDGAHSKLAQQGNPNTPICASCHNAHTQESILKDANGDPAPSERPKIANICAKCHSTIVAEYANSVHGAALFQDSNPDVPACNDCHGIHNISQARTVEFRLNSPQLCATCHTREDIMNKYGISTDVMNTYVSDFHGTTVMMFEKDNPQHDTNKPVCYDCHGVHNIASVSDPQRGLEIKQNMLVTCQKCHPDASKNFPTSWMSHYIASPTRFPLVYYVQLFYKIFIPTVLGGMGLFVVSDILHRMGILGRKSKAAVSTEEGKKE